MLGPWWTGRPGVLQFMGSKRVRHNWATELNGTELNGIRPCFYHQSHPQLDVVFALVPSLNSFSVNSFSFLVISPHFSSSILGTYWPGEFIFQCPIFLPFHTFHGVLKARILKWFAIPFSSGPHFVRTLCHDPSILGGPTWRASYFHWVREGCGLWNHIG